MKVKVGDNVRILAGKDKGKEGKVLRTLKSESKVVVEGINMVKKHSKPRTTNESGGIFDVEAPMHVSNVKVITTPKKEAKKADKTKKVEEAKVEEVKKTTKKKETKATSKKASK